MCHNCSSLIFVCENSFLPVFIALPRDSREKYSLQVCELCVNESHVSQWKVKSSEKSVLEVWVERFPQWRCYSCKGEGFPSASISSLRVRVSPIQVLALREISPLQVIQFCSHREGFPRANVIVLRGKIFLHLGAKEYHKNTHKRFIERENPSMCFPLFLEETSQNWAEDRVYGSFHGCEAFQGGDFWVFKSRAGAFYYVRQSSGGALSGH